MTQLTNTQPHTDDTQHGRTRRRRLKAMLAGGLVLGVGAAITLAAWNDSEFAQGTFASGAFNLEGSLDGTAFSEHPTAAAGSAADLDFTLDAANLSPGDVVFAPFAIRLDDTTTYDATTAITATTSAGAVVGLTYSLTQPTAFGCDGTTTGTSLVPAGTAVGTVPADTTLDLTAGTSPDAGDPAYLCFTVTAGATLPQSQTGTVTWQFQAVSE